MTPEHAFSAIVDHSPEQLANAFLRDALARYAALGRAPGGPAVRLYLDAPERAPADLVPEGESPASHLRRLTREGERRRFPGGTPLTVQALIRKELALISEMRYEHYFLTIQDIVAYHQLKQYFLH